MSRTKQVAALAIGAKVTVKPARQSQSMARFNGVAGTVTYCEMGPETKQWVYTVEFDDPNGGRGAWGIFWADELDAVR